MSVSLQLQQMKRCDLLPQAAAMRVANKVGISIAAWKGDLALVSDHVAAEPASVNDKDDL